MSLMRFLARSMFAGYFIVDGIKAVSKPEEGAPDAEAFTGKVAPLLQRAVPAEFSSYVPDDAKSWVRIMGVAQIAGGAMFATGIGRRLGALLLAKSSVLGIAMALPAKDAPKAAKDAARPDVLRGVALLGASLLAAQDTQGKPSLAWRADQAAKVTEKKAGALGDDVARSARSAVRRTEKKARRIARKARRQARSIGRQIEAATA